MKVNHIIDNYVLSEENHHKDISFMVPDGYGGYFWDRQKSESRYQGWFVNLNNRVFKIVDSITTNYDNKNIKVADICATDKQAILETANSKEKIYTNGFNCFKYSLSHVCEISIFLDIRPINEFPKWNRIYNIYSNNEYLIIKYSHPTHSDIFVAIFKKDILSRNKLTNWVKKEYLYDKKRHSFPNKLYVFQALRIKAQSLTLGAGLSEKEAIQRIENMKAGSISYSKKPSPQIKDEAFAYKMSQIALKSFLVDNENFFGLYAGIPWFMQFWLRDEAISLKGLYKTTPEKTIKLCKLRLKQIINNNFPSSVIKSDDGILWYIYRLLAMNLLKFQNSNVEQLVKISEKIYHTPDSWMDTLTRQDAVENYCLQLAIYHYAYKITQEDVFLDKERELKKFTRLTFWNDSFLADTRDNWVIRPNIFLAYYVYPNLLKKSEWEICFDTALKDLWCQWGGLSTISQGNPQYHKKHTGEDPSSYHQGDSWFWLNNLAALSMLKLNKQKYQAKILKIKQASLKDLLSYQVLGFSSELSSADSLNPSGSPAQTWSSSSLIEILSSS